MSGKSETPPLYNDYSLKSSGEASVFVIISQVLDNEDKLEPHLIHSREMLSNGRDLSDVQRGFEDLAKSGDLPSIPVAVTFCGYHHMARIPH